MKIECFLQDEPFSTAIGDDTYEFAEDAKGRLVAEVWKPRHIVAFMARTDAYREVAEDAVAAEKPAAVTAFDPETANRADLIAFLRERRATFDARIKIEVLREMAMDLLTSGGVSAAPDVAAAALSLSA